MTKTDTRDVRATLAQIRRLERAGCEIVRLAVPDREAAEAAGRIRARTRVPLIADIHFDHRLALACLGHGIDGLRLNPGTIGSAAKVREVVVAAKARAVPIRIGVNSGSLEKDLLERFGGATAEAMAESALRHIKILEDLDFRLIKVSLKASDVPRTVEAYRLLAQKVDYPFHAGITEAGPLLAGAVKSSVGLGILLSEGLADTIRVSLTAPPEEEVKIAWRILAGLEMRQPGAEHRLLPDLRPVRGGGHEGHRRAGSRRPWSPSRRRSRSPSWAARSTVRGSRRKRTSGVSCGQGAGALYKGGRLLRRVPEAEIVPALLEEVRALIEERKTS